jgi:contact-dependent growth inhibition (CDI) system restriction endonuclease-like protein
MTRHAAWHMWRLSEAGEDNLGLACSDDGLVLGRTPLIERRDGHFAVREQREIERLLSRAYRSEISADRIMSGLATVARALNANDQCLARITAVHLRVLDIPDRTARDAMEATDVLIKYARDEGASDGSNWNPALHPRAGTPPNPGWFAPTSDSGESLPVRSAQNVDAKQQSDASESVALDRLILPPAYRNDEFVDLLTWIRNAESKDAQAIEAEIKRQFYDRGDTGAGNALNAELHGVLGIEHKDRQRIQDAIGPYSQSEQDDEETETWIGFGVLLLSLIPPLAEAGGAAVIWRLKPFIRGWYFDALFRDKSLHPLSRTIDNFSSEGAATSIKSLDLNAGTYQDFGRLTSRLNKYLDDLDNYRGTDWGGDTIDNSDITTRKLLIVVPGNSRGSNSARAAIEDLRARAKKLGIDLAIFEH